MSRGSIDVSKITRNTYSVSFFAYDGSRNAAKSKRDRNVEEVRAVLEKIGVAHHEIDSAIADARRKGIAILRSYSLSDERADELQI